MTFIQESLNKGRISRWEKSDFPLPFYMEPCHWYAAQGEEFKYNQLVLKALQEWELRSNGLVKFRLVEKLYDSKVNLSWKRVDRKSLGQCSFNFDKFRLFSAEVEIGLSDGIIHQQYMDDKEVLHTILHEIGHALGLGHSKDKRDIMYTPHQYGIVNISENDIRTLEYIYAMPIGLGVKQLADQFNIPLNNFDDIIDTLEKRYVNADDDNSSQTQQQNYNSQNRNLSAENERIANLKKYTMTLQNINVNVDKMINKSIYKKENKRRT